MELQSQELVQSSVAFPAPLDTLLLLEVVVQRQKNSKVHGSPSVSECLGGCKEVGAVILRPVLA